MSPVKPVVFLKREPMPGRGMLPGGRVYDLIGQPLEVEPGSERDWSEGAVAWEWNALREL